MKAGSTSRFGGWAAYISAGIAIIGGIALLLFYAIEGVRRKPLRPEAQEWAFRTGLAVLLALMIFVTFNDLASFGLFEKLGGLIG